MKLPKANTRNVENNDVLFHRRTRTGAWNAMGENPLATEISRPDHPRSVYDPQGQETSMTRTERWSRVRRAGPGVSGSGKRVAR